MVSTFKTINSMENYINYLLYVIRFHYNVESYQNLNMYYDKIIEKQEIEDIFYINKTYYKLLEELKTLINNLDITKKKFKKISFNPRKNKMTKNQNVEMISIDDILFDYFKIFSFNYNAPKEVISKMVQSIPFSEKYFMCVILEDLIEKRKIEMILLISWIFNSIKEIFNILLLDEEAPVKNLLVDLYTETTIKYEKIHMINKEIQVKNFIRSFSHYISNDILENAETINKKYSSFVKEKKVIKSTGRVNFFKAILLKNIEILYDFMFSFLVFLVDLMKIDNINIFKTIKLLIFQTYTLRANSFNKKIGRIVNKIYKINFLITNS